MHCHGRGVVIDLSLLIADFLLSFAEQFGHLFSVKQ